jgi:hypothetical protein
MFGFGFDLFGFASAGALPFPLSQLLFFRRFLSEKSSANITD